MKVRKIYPFCKDYRELAALQKSAFPKEEQYPLWALHLLALRKGVNYICFEEDNHICGLMYYAQTDKMIYVLYAAVSEQYRGSGFGSRMFKWLIENAEGREVTLNIEPIDESADNYQQRVRRLHFYERLGFRDTNAYLNDTTGCYSILSTSNSFSAEEYKKAIYKLAMNLYKPKIGDPKPFRN